MSPYRAFDTLAKALNPGESTACQNSVEGMEGSIHLIAGDSSINYIEKEGPLLSDSHVAFRVLPYILIFFLYCVTRFDFSLPVRHQSTFVVLLKSEIFLIKFKIAAETYTPGYIKVMAQ